MQDTFDDVPDVVVKCMRGFMMPLSGDKQLLRGRIAVLYMWKVTLVAWTAARERRITLSVICDVQRVSCSSNANGKGKPRRR